MTIHYPADWLVNGGPPFDNHCDFADFEPSEVFGVTLIFAEDTWLITDLTSWAILASFPVDEYDKAVDYITTVAGLTCLDHKLAINQLNQKG